MLKSIRMLIVAILLLVAGTVQAKNLSAWLVGGYDNTLTARVMYDLSPNVSAGGEVSFFELDNLPGSTGLCAIYKLPDAIQLPNPIPLSFLPATLEATPYVGARAGVDITNNGTYSGLIAGVTVHDTIVIEYWPTLGTDFNLSGVDAEDKIYVGAMFKF